MGMSQSRLEERSSFIRFMHFETVCSYSDFMLVPARISSLRVVGSFINELICNYYYYSPFMLRLDCIMSSYINY